MNVPQLKDPGSEPEEPLTEDDEGTVALLRPDSDSDLVEENEERPEVTLSPPPTYHCGCGPCKPTWLQKFVSAKMFTALLCAFSLIEGTTVSGE